MNPFSEHKSMMINCLPATAVALIDAIQLNAFGGKTVITAKPAFPPSHMVGKTAGNELKVNSTARLRWLAASGPVAVSASAILTWAALPSNNFSWLIWVALVPLLRACATGSLLRALMLGLLYGSLSNLLICSWIFQVSGFTFYHAAPLALYVALYPAAWCVIRAYFSRRQISFLIPGAALWIILEYLKNHAGFLAFPWASLAHSQHANLPLLQLCQFTGEYGVTFLIVLVNIAIAEFAFNHRYRKILIVFLLTVTFHGLGYLNLKTDIPDRNESLTVTTVQPSILREERRSDEGRAISSKRLMQLTREAALTRPDLIVLPETAIRKYKKGSESFSTLREISQNSGVPILFGASDIEKFVVDPPAGEADGVTFKKQFYNSAYMLSAEGRFSKPYRKMIRVPFGEYNPLGTQLHLPKWFIPDMAEVGKGDAYRFFSLPGGSIVAPAICWEILFANFITTQLKHRKPDLLVNISNNNWFGRSAAPFQQNAAAVFRAVENRIPVIICSNTGPSQAIDAFGRVVAINDTLFISDIQLATITKGTAFTKTFYSRFGDRFVLVGLVLFIIGGGVCAGRSIGRYYREKLRLIHLREEC